MQGLILFINANSVQMMSLKWKAKKNNILKWIYIDWNCLVIW